MEERSLDDLEQDTEVQESGLDDQETDDWEGCGLDDPEGEEWEESDLDDGEDSGVEPQSAGDRLQSFAPTPGCAVSFYADNKLHHGMCLAVIGDELLLEHKGASRCFLFTGKVTRIVPRLRVGVASATIIVGGLKSCRYRSLHKKWLKEMVRTGQKWKGIERGGGLAPAASELFKDDGQLDLF